MSFDFSILYSNFITKKISDLYIRYYDYKYSILTYLIIHIIFIIFLFPVSYYANDESLNIRSILLILCAPYIYLIYIIIYKYDAIMNTFKMMGFNVEIKKNPDIVDVANVPVVSTPNTKIVDVPVVVGVPVVNVPVVPEINPLEKGIDVLIQKRTSNL